MEKINNLSSRTFSGTIVTSLSDVESNVTIPNETLDTSTTILESEPINDEEFAPKAVGLFPKAPRKELNKDKIYVLSDALPVTTILFQAHDLL